MKTDHIGSLDFFAISEEGQKSLFTPGARAFLTDQPTCSSISADFSRIFVGFKKGTIGTRFLLTPDMFSLPQDPSGVFTKCFTFLSHKGVPVRNLVACEKEVASWSFCSSKLVYSYSLRNKPLISTQMKFEAAPRLPTRTPNHQLHA